MPHFDSIKNGIPSPPPPPSSPPPMRSELPDYAELYCVSNFTFLEGASHADELVERAATLGYQAIAITDECSMAGIVRAHEAAQRHQLKLIVGSVFQLQGEAWLSMRLLILAKDRIAYGNLCEWISLGRGRTEKGQYHLSLEDLHSPPAELTHLAYLPGCLFILIPDYPLQLDVLEQQVQWFNARVRQRFWIGVCQYRQAADYFQQQQLHDVSLRYDLPLVALGHVLMHKRSRKPLQDCLRAIRLGQSVQECGHQLAPNAEQHLRSRLRLGTLFTPQQLNETLKIAQQCQFSLSELRYEYPREIVPENHTPSSYLRLCVEQGAQQRYPHGLADTLRAQIEHELTLIAELHYEAYFLTVYDIVNFARQQGILCQGRGSAANSIVCYCLHITEVNPENHSLLFERFISRERGEPPDIDVDFEHQRREEVIQYIYRKYGRNRTALAAAVHTYRPRGALRETGKALGIDPALIDVVAKSQRWFDSKDQLSHRMQEAGIQIDDKRIQLWMSLTLQLLRTPRHLSQHSGGFVIARDKLTRLVPVELAAMPERSVIQWDKDDLEALGLLKVDILALGMLSMLRRALALLQAWPDRPHSLQAIPREDRKTYDMICRADTIGVFQIESRAQMSMLPRLAPRCFYDLVIQVAIVRPGPIQGGMVHPYLRRRQGLEPIERYPNPAMERALGRTLGIPIFQEQVMQIAMYAADFSAGEADALRRAMAAWKRKGGLEHYRDRIVERMVANHYSRQFAESIFEQMKGFGEYGFPESHAASFALLAYFSSWIKCHEPAAFLCALLNSQPMGFYSSSQLVEDARRHRVAVLPADVMYSDWEARLEGPARPHPLCAQPQAAVRLGLNQVQGLSQAAAQRLIQERTRQSWRDLNDLVQRAQLNKRDIDALAQANTLKTLCGHRRHAIWEAASAYHKPDLLQTTRIAEQLPLFEAPSESDDVRSDYQHLGLSLGRHPVSFLRRRLQQQRFSSAIVLRQFDNGRLARACGLVTVRQRPGTAKGVLFITLEDETGNVNVIVWPALFERFRTIALSARLLGVYGKWQQEAGVHHLIAQHLVDLTPMLGELAPHSRDFC